MKHHALAQPAVLLGQHEVVEAKLLHARQQIGGKLVLFLHLLDARLQLGCDELLDGIQHELLIFVQVIHG